MDINTPEYEAGILAGIVSVSGAAGNLVWNQAVQDGILDPMDAHMTLNQGLAVNDELEFHILHGDVGEQEVSLY